MELRTETAQGGAVSIICPRCDIDLCTAPDFARQALALIDSGCRRLVVDAGDVEYLDSSGVGSIIHILQRMKAAGGRVVFTGLSGAPLRVLRMCNIANVMTIRPDRDSAFVHLGLAPTLSPGKAAS